MDKVNPELLWTEKLPLPLTENGVPTLSSQGTTGCEFDDGFIIEGGFSGNNWRRRTGLRLVNLLDGLQIHLYMVQNENSEEDRLRSLYCEIDNTKMHYQTEQIVIHTDQQQEQDAVCSCSIGYPLVQFFDCSCANRRNGCFETNTLPSQWMIDGQHHRIIGQILYI